MDLQDLLPDTFSKDLLSGSLRVAEDTDNPVRMHLAAAGLRELFSHILHLNAPDDEVRACNWFVQADNTNTVTRRQKAIFATQGGFSDAYISSLGVDVSDLHKAAIKAIETLNKATHVRLGNVESNPERIRDFINNALEALKGLLISFSEGRDAIKEALLDHVYTAMSRALISEAFQTLDLLSSKGYEISPWIYDEEVIIENIMSRSVAIRITGVVSAIMHYGPHNDAAQIEHDFPFWMIFEAQISEPTKLKLITHHIDDTSWYE